MDWNDLRVFVAVCQEGSVSGAGQTLGLSHTTVSRRMSALEDELGARLFDRSRDGYSMTQAAEDILARALKMEEQALAIHRETDGRDQQLRGSLVLTVPYDFAVPIVIPRLPRFIAQYPCIDLELSTGLELADLNARDADIALRITASPPEQLIGRKVLPLNLGIYASRDYLRRCQAPEIVLYRRYRSVPDWAKYPFPSLRMALRVDSVVALHQSVREGLGIARLPCFLGDADPTLLRLDVESPTTTFGIWVLHHPDLRATARVRACRDFLYETLEENRTLILGEASSYTSPPAGWFK